MRSMELLQPANVEEACAVLAQHGDGAKIIAGGTALVIMLKNRLISPSVLVSLGGLNDLRYIRHEPGVGLRIGALTTIREGELSQVVREKNPTLAHAFADVANVRVRHAATIGGNLSEADYASDPPCVLMAMGGRIKARSVRGEREIPLRGFFRGFYETSLERDEVLTEVIVPERSANTGSAYIKFVTRSSEDRPCVGVAAVVETNPDGTCTDLRLVVGAVAEVPQEIESAEAMARGKRLTDALIEEIGRAYASGIQPISDLRGSEWYRREITSVLIRRALQKALAAPDGKSR